MKINKFTPALFILALASCTAQNEEITNPSIENEAIVIRASSEGASTRTALSGDDFTEVVWQAGDAMNFYPVVTTDGAVTSKMPGDATLQEGYKLTTTDSGKSANFTAEDLTVDLTQATASDNSSIDATDFFALTPYLSNDGTAASNIKINNADGGVRGTVYFRMPSEQIYVENSFDPSVAFAFAKTTSIDEPLTFENQFGVLRLNITGVDTQVVTSIEVTANDDASGTKRFLTGFINACTSEDIAGGKAISVSGTEGTIKFQTVTMDCGEGVTLSDVETAFNVVLVPFTGITVTINYTEDGEEKSLTKVTNSAISRSGLTNMPTLDLTPAGTEPEGGEDNTGSTEDLDKNDGTWE